VQTNCYRHTTIRTLPPHPSPNLTIPSTIPIDFRARLHPELTSEQIKFVADTVKGSV